MISCLLRVQTCGARFDSKYTKIGMIHEKISMAPAQWCRLVERYWDIRDNDGRKLTLQVELVLEYGLLEATVLSTTL